MRKAVWFLIVSVLLMVVGSISITATEDKILMFKDIRVFDGNRVISKCTVLVKGSIIVSVGTKPSIPPGAEIIEGKDLTLMPGLIDSHVHAAAFADLRQALVFGVTTQMDMFTDPGFLRPIKASQAKTGNPYMSDFFSSGILATAPGGHGTEYGMDIPTLKGPEDAEAFVAARITEGSDYIKLCYDTLGFKPSLELDTVAALADAAREKNRLTLAHLAQAEAARSLAKAGVSGFAHTFADTPPDQELVQLILDEDVFMVPTLSVMNRLEGAKNAELSSDPLLLPYFSPENIRALTPSTQIESKGVFSYAAARETVKRLHKAGVPILAGTDTPNAGTVQGASMHGEMALLVDAGLTPLEALAAATSVPAAEFGLVDRGRIKEGFRADLVLIKGNPAEEITATRNIVGIWKLGVKQDREAYRVGMEKRRAFFDKTGKMPAPVGSASGLISDFEAMNLSSEFGYFWFTSSDYMENGKSTVAVSAVRGGALNSSGSLLIKGNIQPGAQFPWAGVIHYAGEYPWAANLSDWNSISFWAKGEDKDYLLMTLFEGEQMPAFQMFHATGEWQEFKIPFNTLNNSDGSNILGILIGAGGAYRVSQVGHYTEIYRGSE